MFDTSSPTDADWLLINDHPATDVSLASFLFSVCLRAGMSLTLSKISNLYMKFN